MATGDDGARASGTLPSGTVDVEAQSVPATPDHNLRSPARPSTHSQDIPRLPRRSQTAKSYRPKARGRSWKPGQEPGIDVSSRYPASLPVGLKENCEITVVDFSQHDIQVNYLDNSSLEEFLQSPRDKNLNCHWINVNGLSWDVISLLAKENNFHKLAIEDMLNRRNRTKSDWYSDHSYSKLALAAKRLLKESSCPASTKTSVYPSRRRRTLWF